MIATNLLTNEKVEVIEANKYIHQVFPKAEYYSLSESYTCAYEFCKGISVNDIPNEFRYCYDIINNKLYRHTLTSKYDKLIKMYKEDLQLNIFDFLEV